MLQFLKNKARKLQLKTQVQRVIKSSNFNNAKNIGVVMCYHYEIENDSLNMIKHIAKENKANVKMVIFYPQDKLPANVISNPDRILISNLECNWFGKPKSKDVEDFIEEEFDMLIDFSDDIHFSTQYITYKSKAKFKIGRFNYHNNPFDFVLIDESQNDEQFVTNIKSYPTKIV